MNSPYPAVRRPPSAASVARFAAALLLMSTAPAIAVVVTVLSGRAAPAKNVDDKPRPPQHELERTHRYVGANAPDPYPTF